MRDPNRIDKVCDEIKEIWKRYPDFRFGQLMDNLFVCMKQVGRDPFYIEDELFVKYLDAYMSGKPAKEVENNVTESTEDLSR